MELFNTRYRTLGMKDGPVCLSLFPSERRAVATGWVVNYQTRDFGRDSRSKSRMAGRYHHPTRAARAGTPAAFGSDKSQGQT